MQPLEVHVVDDHHHVLEPIHRAIRQRRLPFANCTIVHVDAHADLAFPPSLPAATIFSPGALYDGLDASDAGIASFLLPLAYAGHIHRLVWIKPPWATQMAIGTHTFHVGQQKDTGCLGVTSHASYFVDENLYAPLDALEKPASLELTVAELPAAPLPEGPYVLDICLDYFQRSTRFAKVYAAVDITRDLGDDTALLLSGIYGDLAFKKKKAELPHSTRLEHARLFATTMTTLFRERVWEDRTAYDAHMAPLIDLYTLSPTAVAEQFVALRNLLLTASSDELAMMEWAGPCMDLPQHKASDDEIEGLLAALETFLTTAGRPRLVTIAESKDDEYTPPGQVEMLLARVLSLLGRRFGALNVSYDDQSEEDAS
ncbi:hypothetical protein SPRG_01724 [Saprolegnia parasitica CBS 223.65]|uniref:Uncharacterized protein n=1 Tax=Saprolegnia parasitica (strain CBS 223.65) TaxID=695850 RepID=A0A067CX65_SAPPC|nr:hypothetical protein SPRG_01724 [Saprolegnia parasitica CBS 223.65]KDO33845.1 hypothetical protein SPRG_01724 [Saprolegnia parasitica CBS 223.65]|eukprot:XP_012195481.1 hypothetical protein SPRG_01724 [Saprolegnia parasitica CBS 223.65]